MTEKKTRTKHIGYTAQREQCRLNKYTYNEKIYGASILFCNYPFGDPTHKKGLCKAGTCTDMREIPDDVVAADAAFEAPDTLKDETVEVPGDGATGEGVDAKDSTFDNTEMPCPKNE